MKTTVDLTDGTGKASAVITKSETGEPVTVISISQQFLHEPRASRLFLSKQQAIRLRDFLNEHIN